MFGHQYTDAKGIGFLLSLYIIYLQYYIEYTFIIMTYILEHDFQFQQPLTHKNTLCVIIVKIVLVL